MYINKVVEGLEISTIRQIAQKMGKYEDGINLTIGEPSQLLPEIVKKEMIDKINKDMTKYTQTGGMPELLTAVAKFYNDYFEGDYNYENALITAGSTESISSYFRTILKEGDEVLLPTPVYPGYAPNVLMSGAIPIYIDLKDNNYVVTADILEKYINEKTKLIVLTFPNNPNGVTMELEEMDKVAKLLRKYPDIYLASDEIYATMAFDKYYSFARYKDLKKQIAIITGFSKSHSMTGLRVGYTLTDEKIIKNMKKVSQYTVTGVNTIAQYGAIKALEECPIRKEVVLENKRRCDYIIPKLEELGFKCIKPKGAFYIFANYEAISSLDSLSFALDVMEKVHLGIVPGESFRVEGFIRISVVQDEKVLDEAIDRLKRYIELTKKEN